MITIRDIEDNKIVSEISKLKYSNLFISKHSQTLAHLDLDCNLVLHYLTEQKKEIISADNIYTKDNGAVIDVCHTYGNKHLVILHSHGKITAWHNLKKIKTIITDNAKKIKLHHYPGKSDEIIVSYGTSIKILNIVSENYTPIKDPVADSDEWSCLDVFITEV